MVRWHMKLSMVQGAFIVLVSYGWRRAGVRTVLPLCISTCVLALWSSVWLKQEDGKRKRNTAYSCAVLELSLRGGRLGWCVSECRVGEVLGADNSPAHPLQTSITIAVVYIVIAEWEQTQFLQINSWKWGVQSRDNPGFQLLVRLSLRWAARKPMRGLMHIFLCSLPKSPLRMMKGLRWSWRRTTQYRRKENSHWRSRQFRRHAPRKVRARLYWERCTRRQALLERHVFSLTLTFEAMLSNLRRKVHWLWKKVRLKMKEAAEAWRKRPRISAQHHFQASVFLSQVGSFYISFWSLVNCQFSVFVVLVKCLGSKSCVWSSRTQQARRSLSSICQFWYFVAACLLSQLGCWFFVNAMLNWLISQCVSGYEYASGCPCVGNHSENQTVLSVMSFVSLVHSALRGNFMFWSLSPMENSLAMGNQHL